MAAVCEKLLFQFLQKHLLTLLDPPVCGLPFEIHSGEKQSHGILEIAVRKDMSLDILLKPYHLRIEVVTP